MEEKNHDQDLKITKLEARINNMEKVVSKIEDAFNTGTCLVGKKLEEQEMNKKELRRWLIPVVVGNAVVIAVALVRLFT